ncbi:hypothetical protein CD798_00440 [Bacillaceae bacterium SAOS 7]|nr:hypothetical protein CD798_00440 [Bacillaceae bacterium SAOS 7]
MEGFKVTNKKETNKSIDVIDVFWDGWFNGFKTFYSSQDGLEQRTLQVFERQKDWINSSRAQISKLEENSKKLSSEWKSNMMNSSWNQQELGGKNLAEWVDQLEEISYTTQELAMSPGKASIEMLSKSQAHLEETYKNALEAQQQNRAEVLKACEDLINQLKQTQKGMLQSFELIAK